jgi:hypothetical protein
MNTLPPLPLIDGHFLIDNSGLEKLKCPRCYQYSELNRRVPTAERAGANFGSTIHRGLEARYHVAGCEVPSDAQTAAINNEMQQWLQENPQPEGDFRNFNHACKVMAVYNNVYKKEHFEILKNHEGKPIIESTFALPIGEVQNVPIIYCGKIDLGIKDNNGVWSFDHKTTFQFGDTFDKQMNMDGGQLGYCWALGQTVGIKPQGYIIDAIRVRRPKKSDEFSEISCVDGTDFKRTPYYVSQDMLDEWKNDVLNLVADIFHYHDRSYFPRHRWQCTNKYGMCDYYDVCSTVREQRDQILNGSLFEENKWSKGLKLENNEKKDSL